MSAAASLTAACPCLAPELQLVAPGALQATDCVPSRCPPKDVLCRPQHRLLLTGSSVATTTASLPKFPSEEPTKKELSEWLDASCAILSRTGHGPAIRGETPPGFHQLKFQMAMPDIPALPTEERDKLGPVEATKYDLLRAETARKKNAALEAYESGMREYKNKLAATLDAAMRKTAPLRLNSMLDKHVDAAHPGIYDGGAMWRDLEAMRNIASRIDDRLDHDRAVEHARDSALPDGCSANTYLKKVNTIVVDHLPYMERPYTGHALGRFLISLMPNANKVEGRILESELDKPGDTRLSDGPYVIERCAAIVLKSQTKQADSTTLASALAMAQQDPTMRPLCDALRAAKLTSAAALTKAAGAPKQSAKKDAVKTDKKIPGRLPNGQTCKEGTCNFPHDIFAPGSRCYRSPDFHGPLEEKFMKDPAQLDRLDAARKKNAERMGVPFVPLPRPKIPVSAVVPLEQLSFDDGLDYCEECAVPAALFLPYGPVVPSPPPSPPKTEIDSDVEDLAYQLGMLNTADRQVSWQVAYDPEIHPWPTASAAAIMDSEADEFSDEPDQEAVAEVLDFDYDPQWDHGTEDEADEPIAKRLTRVRREPDRYSDMARCLTFPAAREASKGGAIVAGHFFPWCRVV